MQPEFSEELNENIEAMMCWSENSIKVGGSRSKNGELQMWKAYICQVYLIDVTIGQLLVHIESHHLDGIFIPCNQCKRTYR